MKTIVILGSGTAGTTMANRLRRRLPEKTWRIVVVDRDDAHVYQPGLLFVPFGDSHREELVRPRGQFLPPGVDLILSEVAEVQPEHNRVCLRDGTQVSYDFLVVASGTRIVPEATQGLNGPGWYRNAFDFYTLDGADALAGALAGFEGGRVVLNIVEMPIKCPVAPLEWLFLADAYFTRRGIRDKVELVLATPLDGAFTKPRASASLGGMLQVKGIDVTANFNLETVDTEKRVLRSYDNREVDYDLLVSIPQHQGSEFLTRSGLGNDTGFVPTDKHTLQTRKYPNIFALGDATDLPTSKAGSVAHFQSEVLTENILCAVQNRSLTASSDGHANCFIETGFGKAMLIDFNYDTEPLPGRFPLPGVGPFTLLEESHANHWGKLGFRWVYWNALVAGKDLPLDHRMSTAGKWREA